MPSKTASSATGPQKVLAALAELKMGHRLEEAPKKRVASMAEIPSATFPSLISRMAKKGLVAYGSTPEMLQITDKGMEQAGPMDIPTTNEEAQERTDCRAFPATPHAMLTVLNDALDRELSCC